MKEEQRGEERKINLLNNPEARYKMQNMQEQGLRSKQGIRIRKWRKEQTGAVTPPDISTIQKTPEKNGYWLVPCCFLEKSWSKIEPLKRRLRLASQNPHPLHDKRAKNPQCYQNKIKSIWCEFARDKWVYNPECFGLHVTKSQITLACTTRNWIISRNWEFRGKGDRVQHNQQSSKVIRSSGFFCVLSSRSGSSKTSFS